MNSRFKKAQAGLYKEIDLLQLVKKLRYANLLWASQLKPHHSLMIKNFSKYCVNSDQSQEDSNSDKNSSDSNHDIEEIFTLQHEDNENKILSDLNDLDQNLPFLTPQETCDLVKKGTDCRFSSNDQNTFLKWQLGMRRLLELRCILANFQPQDKQNNYLDHIALKMLLGKIHHQDQKFVDQVFDDMKTEHNEMKEKIKNLLETEDGKKMLSNLQREMQHGD